MLMTNINTFTCSFSCTRKQNKTKQKLLQSKTFNLENFKST